jgi:hypothetical protein
MPESPADTPQMVSLTPDAVVDLADTLAAHGHRIQAAAGGAPRSGPSVPYDWFDLHGAITALDEAREAFDLRLAGFLLGVSGDAADQVQGTRSADGHR